MVECSECGGELTLEKKARIGDILECPECATELEVVDNDPLILEAAEENEEEEPTAAVPEEEEGWLH